MLIDMDEKEYRLAAIMYTDIAGFSRMMETNEKRTLELLARHNSIIEGAVRQFRGTVIKTIGDAYMVDFKNSVDALNCALKVQYDLYDYNKENRDLPLLVRIGLHIGDIYFYENDALGEGINIAARLQSVAHPGCICMSQHLYNLVLNKVDFAAEKLGKVSLKNITKEIIAYEIVTPNVEFDPNRDARPVLNPEKIEKGVVTEPEVLKRAEQATAGEMSWTKPAMAVAAAGPEAEVEAEAKAEAGKAESTDKRGAIKKAILSEIQTAGRRLTVDEVRRRYAAEMPLAEDVIQELAEKGILKSEALFAEGPWKESDLGSTLSEVAREVSIAFKEAVEIAREEYRSEQRRLRSGSRSSGQSQRRKSHEGTEDAAEGPRQAHQPEAVPNDAYESYDDYAEKIEREARHATGGFIGHLVPFVMVNGFLMVLNATVSPGFPWALFPFGGWGIGLLEHYAGTLRTKDKYRDLKKLPPLNDEQLSIFKKLQKKKDELWHSGTGLIPTSAFLFMINLITSRGFLWSLIPIFFMSMGFLGNLVKTPGEIAALKQDLQDSLRKGSTRGSRKKQASPGTSGPYGALVQEAAGVREAILEMVQLPETKDKQKGGQKSSQKMGVPEAEELIPVLDAYVEQVQLLADRTAEVDRIIELIPRAALERDKQLLEQKLREPHKPELQKEYEKALEELKQQEASFKELGEQRDLLELKLRSSVNNLKQMQIDIGRIISLTGSGESGADRSLHYKTEELNRYLEDLRSGYEEVERLENRAVQGSLED
uniref:Guanylate cyclase domain-containing protein n=1 Tax=Gracilinema caldarium TaxID=215591 RepID=A0A7C3E0Y1_9SPIR